MKLFNIKQTFIIGLFSILLPFYSMADEKTPQHGGTLVVH